MRATLVVVAVVLAGCGEADVSGTWVVQFFDATPGVAFLTQTGSEVTGVYRWPNREGRVTGQAGGDPESPRFVQLRVISGDGAFLLEGALSSDGLHLNGQAGGHLPRPVKRELGWRYSSLSNSPPADYSVFEATKN
jgi:hypothetical protein